MVELKRVTQKEMVLRNFFAPGVGEMLQVQTVLLLMKWWKVCSTNPNFKND